MMPGSDNESETHNVLLSSIKQEPVDWIIEENIDSDEDDVSSSHLNKHIKKELNETIETESPSREKLKRKCKSKQITKSSKAARFNSLIANLKEKALSKHCNNETVTDNTNQNRSIDNEQNEDVWEGKVVNLKIKEEHDDLSDSNLNNQNSYIKSPQTCTTSVGSLISRISKEMAPLQNTRRISDMTLRNMLNHVPTVITNGNYMTSQSDSVEYQNNDSIKQRTFSDKTWLPRLTELIKSKPNSVDEDFQVSLNGTTSGMNTKYDQLLKLLVSRRAEETSKFDGKNEICKRMLTSNTLSSLLTGKTNDLKSNSESVLDDSFDCQECNKTFRTFASLTAHKKYHRMKQKLVCTTCKKEFSVKREFERHLKEHDADVEYTCSICGKNFSVIGAWKRHMLIHRQQPTKDDKFYADDLYGEGLEECYICGEKFSKYYIKYHLKIHSSNRPYTCDKCGKTFAHKQSIVAHKLKHKRELLVWKCKFCDRVFDYEYLLKRHMNLHTKYKCDKCDKTLRNKASYLSHWRVHNTPSYHCDVCNRTYARYSAYFSHYQKHMKMGHVPLPENTAIPELSSNDDLTNTNTDKFDDQVNDDHGLADNHSDGSDIGARVIAEKTDDSILLNVQPSVDNGENESVTIPNDETASYSQISNTCPVCQWDAISPCALKRHMHVHVRKGIKGDKELDDKFYKEGVRECPICGDKFSKYYIKYHMKIHSNDQRYSCDKCEKTFAHKSNLVDHVQTHHRESHVWHCNVCERGFENEYQYTRHMKAHNSYNHCTIAMEKMNSVSCLREALESGVPSDSVRPEVSIEINNVEDRVANTGKDTLINKVISGILRGRSNRKDNSVTSTSTGRMEGDVSNDHDDDSINNANADKYDDEESDSFSNAEADQRFINCMLSDIPDGEDSDTVKSNDQVSRDFVPHDFTNSEGHLVSSNNEVLTTEDEDFEDDVDLPVQFATD